MKFYAKSKKRVPEEVQKQRLMEALERLEERLGGELTEEERKILRTEKSERYELQKSGTRPGRRGGFLTVRRRPRLGRRLIFAEKGSPFSAKRAVPRFARGFFFIFSHKPPSSDI